MKSKGAASGGAAESSGLVTLSPQHHVKHGLIDFAVLLRNAITLIVEVKLGFPTTGEIPSEPLGQFYAEVEESIKQNEVANRGSTLFAVLIDDKATIHFFRGFRYSAGAIKLVHIGGRGLNLCNFTTNGHFKGTVDTRRCIDLLFTNMFDVRDPSIIMMACADQTVSTYVEALSFVRDIAYFSKGAIDLSGITALRDAATPQAARILTNIIDVVQQLSDKDETTPQILTTATSIQDMPADALAELHWGTPSGPVLLQLLAQAKEAYEKSKEVREAARIAYERSDTFVHELEVLSGFESSASAPVVSPACAHPDNLGVPSQPTPDSTTSGSDEHGQKRTRL